MKDYKREYEGFTLRIPAQFSFPLDVVDPWGDAQALFWTDGVVERRFSFRDMTILSSQGAAGLMGTGIRRGDRVLVMLPNIPEWWEVMLSLMRINALPIPATTLLTPKDISYRLAAAEIRAVIATEEDAGKVEEAVTSLSVKPKLMVVGSRKGWMDYRGLRDSAAPYAGERAPADSPALIYFTSGTTGLPKMVLHTQASYPLAHLITGKFWLDLHPGDLHWNLSDPGWAKAAWSSLFGPWHMGATVFSVSRKGRFDPAFTLDILKRYPVTTFCGPPTAYRMMVKESLPGRRTDFHALRHCVAAGEPLNADIIRVWKEKTGLWIYDGYGQTETVNVLANYSCLPVRPGSMGVPAPGFHVEVVDESGNPAPAGAEGDIAIRIQPDRPAGLFLEYLDSPEATAKTIRGQWYITGDRAYRDEDGYFWFVGRADDVILTAGYRIGPFEIESILIEHPAVKESAVVSSPDEVRGEVVKAFIVLTSDYRPSEPLTRELQDFVKKHTAPYKYPRKIEFVTDLPKTISGKIIRKELKMKEWGK